MNILIYTIMRNSESRLVAYHKQITDIPRLFPEHDFYLSIYENDSTDRTSDSIKQLDFSVFKDFTFISETIGTQSFGSTKEEQRVKNLATARNRATFDSGFLDLVDVVMAIEVDVLFSPEDLRKLFNFPKKWDILSGVTYKKGTYVLYDAWATRIENNYDYSFENNRLLSNHWDFPYGKYSSTFNGVCLYQASTFKSVGGYGYLSPINGKSDCDTAVICQKFILNNKSNIFIHYEVEVIH